MKFRILFLFCITSILSFIFPNYTFSQNRHLLIHRNDGKVFSINTNQVDSITFSNGKIDSSWVSIGKNDNSQYYNGLYIYYGEDAKSILPNGLPCQYVYINQHLNDSLDYGMRFGNKAGTINKNFDFQSLYLLEGGEDAPSSCHSSEDLSYTYLAGHNTDYIVAMRLGAVNNADGDFPDNKSMFTGGFHGYESKTSGNYTPTMYEISKKVYADGVMLKPNTAVYCDSVRIVVENLIQGANTEKEDGSGRNILKQIITLKCRGNNYEIDVNLIPLEDIYFYQVNGLCFYNDFEKIQFIGSKTKPDIYPRGQVIRADKCVNVIRQLNDKYNFDVYMDLNYGIGNGEYNDGKWNASSESANKSYFHLISNNQGLFAPANSVYTFKGGYRFGVR